jgi:hypothetical protein
VEQQEMKVLLLLSRDMVVVHQTQDRLGVEEAVLVGQEPIMLGKLETMLTVELEKTIF